ncbi:hypothetical protein PV415_30050 [Streptomyces sp. ME03-5684b]|uniref:hypothetical protein n=1 Tax=Streptomyces sp. ME03-5684b TaxID=3028681 RepID=UPI0029AB05B7|nr:hypothetical protein [Streptomyces sp. ME03-5684b]MDX3321155.1 hypothetical protein [Streptomyces sp. ME03-5684b]
MTTPTQTPAERITAFLDGIPSPHWPAPAGSCLNDSWWGFTEPPPIPANRQTRLVQLYRSTLDAAIALPEAPYKVLLYANTMVDEPAHALAAAETYAYDRGWCVVGRFVDATTDTQPWTREEWPKVLRQLRGGFAQGVVTDGRSAVSTADEPYEQTLRWLSDHFSFIAHARPAPLASAVAR